jgi:hypothetical protein
MSAISRPAMVRQAHQPGHNMAFNGFISQPHDIIVIKRIRYLRAGTSIWLLMTAFPVSNDNFGINKLTIPG